MNVFVVSFRSVCPSGEDSDLKVFSTREKAMQEYEERVCELRKEAEAHGLEIDESDDCFEAYEDGWYWDNHLRVSIEEKELL